jgi:hypothetical protein
VFARQAPGIAMQKKSCKAAFRDAFDSALISASPYEAEQGQTGGKVDRVMLIPLHPT